jgi:hypothetical protein
MGYVRANTRSALVSNNRILRYVGHVSSERENALTMLRCQRLRGRLPSFEDFHRFPLNLLTAILGVSSPPDRLEASHGGRAMGGDKEK